MRRLSTRYTATLFQYQLGPGDQDMATKMRLLRFLKQTKLIRPPRDAELGAKRPPSPRYVYSLTAFVSLGGFLFGWNQGVMGMIVADERWSALMGHPSDWAIGLVVSIYNLSCAAGALSAGSAADALGRERTLSLASGLAILGALAQAASSTIAQMTAGRFITGLGIGAFAAGVPLYISEISPPALRGRIVGSKHHSCPSTVPHLLCSGNFPDCIALGSWKGDTNTC